MQQIISIAKQFSEFPVGRTPADTNVSGQAFREKFLVQRLHNGEKLLIDLDDVEGFGSSFLDEAFAGLIRNDGFTLAQLEMLIEFKADEDPSLVEEIRGYMADEEKKRLA